MTSILLFLLPSLVAAQGVAPTVQQVRAKASELNNELAHLVLIVQGIALALFFACALPRIYRACLHGSVTEGWFLRSRSPKERKPSPFNSSTPISGSIQQVYNKVLLFELPFVGLTVGQCLVILLYVALLLAVGLYNNINTTVSNNSRTGWIAVAQFPAVVALSLKNGPIGLIGIGYDKLNFLHRFAGRALFIFALTHGALFAKLAVEGPAFRTRASHAILTGALALAGAGLIFLTSLKVIRQLSYRLFFYSHMIGFVLFIVAGALHQEHNRPFIYAGVALHLFSNLVRIIKSRMNKATITALPGGLTRVEVHGLSSGWNPGQHVRLRFLTSNLHLLESHPFTIANVNEPADSKNFQANGSLVLYTKAVGPFTNALRKRAEVGTGMSLEKAPSKGSSVGADGLITLTAIVDGPYGGTRWFSLQNATAVFLVAGGSGFTFGFPILEAILKRPVSFDGKCNIQLVWAIRETELLAHFNETFRTYLRLAEDRGINLSLQVYITGPKSASFERSTTAGMTVFQGRPSIDRLLNDFVSSAPTIHGVECATCGPGDLVAQTRAAVGSISIEAARAVGGVNLHSEVFGL